MLFSAARVRHWSTYGQTLVKQQLFETGVDEMSWDDLSQSREDWPSIRDCHAYRKTAYDMILRMLKTTPALQGPATWDTPGWAIFMGFEHERIHIETSSVLIREVSKPADSCYTRHVKVFFVCGYAVLTVHHKAGSLL